MSEDLTDLIYRIAPITTPYFYVLRHSKRRLGRMSASVRGNKRRIARAGFRPMDKLARVYEWKIDAIEGKNNV